MNLKNIPTAFIGLLILAVSAISCNHQDDTPAMCSEEPATVQLDSVETRIGLRMESSGGIYKVPCVVNGVGMKFIFDTGASNVCISLTEALFLYKNGYLEEADLGDTSYATIADGSIVENMEINLHSIEIGGIMVTDIKALVSKNIDAPLLLGQSAIKKLGKLEIDGDSLFLVRKQLPSSEQKRKTADSQSLPRVEEPTWWDNVCAWFGSNSKADEYIEAAIRAYNNDLLELAKSYCEKAIDIKGSDDWRAAAILARIYYDEENYVDAIGYYKDVERLNVKQQTFYFNSGDSMTYNNMMSRLARSYAINSQLNEAMIAAQQIIERSPNDVYAMNVISLCYTKSGDYIKAESWARKMLDLHEDDYLAYFRLAYLAAEQGRKREAIRLYEKAIEIDPNNVSPIKNLALIYEHINWSYSKELIKKAAKLGDKSCQNWLKENGYEW